MSGDIKRCPWCFAIIQPTAETCIPCRSIKAAVGRKPKASEALRGGRWVLAGGIHIWKPFAKPEPTEPLPMVAECGTDKGYQEHTRRRKEPACKECLNAHAVKRRLQRADRRIAAARARAEQEGRAVA